MSREKNLIDLEFMEQSGESGRIVDGVTAKSLANFGRIIIDKSDWIIEVIRVLEKFAEEQFTAVASAIDEDRAAARLW